MFENIITIHPVILNDQSNFVEQSHKMGQNESQQQIPTTAPCNLQSPHCWHKDCFNSVNLETINYIFNVLTLMPAATLTT